MICFPHCKINIGLDVVRKRPDGYHDIATVMFPVRGLCDSLEIVVPDGGAEGAELTVSGLGADCPPQENIVVKAWQLMHEAYGIGGVRMHLHKAIPFGPDWAAVRPTVRRHSACSTPSFRWGRASGASKRSP